MRAVYRTRYGPPEVLEVRDVPTPVPKADELLVRVRAATVNRTDCGGLWGRPFVYRFFAGLLRPKHTATGTDFAGDVEAVGPEATGFAVGDRVWGFDDNLAGTHAQYIVYSTKRAVDFIPAELDYAHAVACLEGAHYALNFIRKLPVMPGRRALVNGATGAIGSAAVQLLKHRGVHVTAVCAGPQVALVEKLGADRVIDSLKRDFTAENAQYDYVLDAVGKSRFSSCKRILATGGIYASSELGPRAENVYLPLLTALSRKRRAVFPVPLDIPGSLRKIRQAVELGAFTPLIDRTYPLDQIREAFTYVASGQKIGNVILSLD